MKQRANAAAGATRIATGPAVVVPSASPLSSPSASASPKRATVPPLQPKCSFPVRAAVTITLLGIYVIGLITTIPGFIPLMSHLGFSTARQYEAGMLHLHSSKESNDTTILANQPSKLFIQSASTGVDWTDWNTVLSPEATHYSLPNWIDAAVPFFFLAIAVEFYIARGKHQRALEKAKKEGKDTSAIKPYFRLNDSLNSMSLGTFQQMFHVGLFIRPLMYAPYVFIWENYAICRFPITWWSWLLTFLLVEFAYYWTHRYGHEMNVFWAAHIAHHSSEEYNLSTALRQGAIQYSAAFIFYFPAAFIIPPPLFSFHNHFNRLYQFWIHTRVIEKCPAWFEYVFNTPSHHRVHHGSNPEYIDCNYGGTLILFDRLFNTFVPEHVPVVFGLTHNVDSWNPLEANWHHWRYMRNSMRRSPTLWRKFQVLWQGPGWDAQNDTLYPLPVADYSRQKYNKQCLDFQKAPAPFVFAILSAISNLIFLKYLVKIATYPSYTLQSWLCCFYITANLTLLGGWMEGKWSQQTLFLLDLGRTTIAAILALLVLQENEQLNQTSFLYVSAGVSFLVVCAVFMSGHIAAIGAAQRKALADKKAAAAAAAAAAIPAASKPLQANGIKQE